MNEQPPSQDAINAATRILLNYPLALNGADVEKIAAGLDFDLQLPQLNAALLCAQSVSDWYERGNADDVEARMEVFGELGQALANIKSKTS